MLFNKILNQFDKDHLSKEIISSLVVFLVALPLCLGIALASGLPPAYGIITGVIGGIVTGFLSGCPLQISGPAGGLIVITAEIVNNFGLEKLGAIVLIAGLIQIFIGFLGLAPWFQVVSPAVVRGMLSGIGVIIFSSQFHVMFGHKQKGNSIENLLDIPNLVQNTIFPQEETTYHIAAGVGVITLLTIFLWKQIPSEKAQAIPPSLVAVLFAVLVTNLLELPIDFVEIPKNIFQEIKMLNLSTLQEVISSGSDLLAAFTLAFIASVQALLTSNIIDQLHLGSNTNHKKEIIAQGAGNACAGILNSLPITGTIIRSVIAINSGGRSKLVPVLQGTWLLLTLLFLSKFVQFIPLASLAAILVFVSIRLIDLKQVKNMLHYGVSEFLICVITFVFVVAVNIFQGVLVGIILSAIKLLINLSKFNSRSENIRDEYYELYLSGAVSFVTLPKLDLLLKGLPNSCKIIINLAELEYIDHSCYEFLSNWEKKYSLKEGTVIVEWDKLKGKILENKE